MGHQIQDVAVQLQMGQSALLIFGQQGGQIASLFGKNGALFGAVIAVGAALGTWLFPKLMSSKDAFEHLTAAGEEATKMFKMQKSGVALLSGKYADLAEESESAAMAMASVALIPLLAAEKNAVNELQQSFSLLAASKNHLVTSQYAGVVEETLPSAFGVTADQAERLKTAMSDLDMSSKESRGSFVNLAMEISNTMDADDELNAKFITLMGTTVKQNKVLNENASIMDVLRDITKGLFPETEAQAKANDELTESFFNMRDALKEELNALRMTDREMLKNSAAYKELSEDAQKVVLGLYDKIAAEKLSQQHTEDMHTALEAEITATEEAAEATADFVTEIVNQSNALSQSNIDLLLAAAANHTLNDAQQQAFDDAIQRMRDFEDAKAATKTSAAVDTAFEGLRKSLRTEEEIVAEGYANQLQIIQDFRDNNLLNTEQANELELRAIEDHEKKKADLKKKTGDEEILRGSELTGSMLDQLGKQFAGVKAVNKKMFAAQKAYKLASAIQNTYTAANEALASPYPWPLPQVFAATAIAAGLANVSAIKASSFEGGGFTGRGSRSGGSDGKGGFLATLHPNESVIDHTKGGGSGLTIVNNIDASGGGPDVDLKIRAAMEQTSQQTVATVQDLMARRRL
jgi:hypothetical protein